jgi:hypothetical protein
MTSQSPRIYLYKITFEEVLYYYYGVHKEKKFDEYYMGSPVTHKRMWDFYTPQKQILQFFDFTNEGWVEAQEIEGRLIKPVFNIDKWCLNANCLGVFSLNHKKKAGIEAKIKKTGIHAFTKEKKLQVCSSGGIKSYELKCGVHSLTSQEKSNIAKRTNSQKWKCLETGFITNSGSLSRYQMKREIDTSKRIRLE